MNDLGTGTRGLLRAVAPDVVPAATDVRRRSQLAAAIPQVNPRMAWLLRAVIARALPSDDEVTDDVRFARLEGTPALMRRLRRVRRHRFSALFSLAPRVVADAVLIDVHETATTRLATGVQRVARVIADRWSAEHEVLLVGWSVDRARLRVIRPGAFARRSRSRLMERRGLVPVGGTMLVPELVIENERNIRLRALAGTSGVRCALIGHDCIPLTQAETAGIGMPGAFAKYLATAARSALIANISDSSRSDFMGWRAMLSATGMGGPELVSVPLPVEAGEARADDEGAARAMLLHESDGRTLPMLLCVGSHEPRKNHGAVLQACEILWREGVEFSAVFLGGNSWSGDEFLTQLARSQRDGRPVTAISSAPDAMLWWAYRLARVSAFPSLSEGFGLPIAESLACGTPVVTSSFGSMAEVAADGGCLLADPRDARDLAAALRSVITDDGVHARLVAAARARPSRTWGDYTADLWSTVVA